MDRCLAAAPNGARVAIPKTTAMLNLNGIGLNAAVLLLINPTIDAHESH